MKAIEIQPCPSGINVSNMYNIGAFTHARPGLYNVEGTLICYNGSCAVMCGSVSIFNTVDAGERVEAEPGVVAMNYTNGSVTASDLLKAIAISQRPELAAQLI